MEEFCRDCINRFEDGYCPHINGKTHSSGWCMYFKPYSGSRDIDTKEDEEEDEE